MVNVPTQNSPDMEFSGFSFNQCDNNKLNFAKNPPLPVLIVRLDSMLA